MIKRTLRFCAHGDRLRPEEPYVLTTWCVQYPLAQFRLDNQFDCRRVYATFIADQGDPITVELDGNGMCVVPWEVLYCDTQYVRVGLRGEAEDDGVIATNFIDIPTVQGVPDGGEDPKDPTHSVFEELREKNAEQDKSLLQHAMDLAKHAVRLDEHDKHLAKNDGELEAHDDRLDVHDTQLETLDERADGHDKTLEAYDKRMDGHEAQLEEHDGRLDGHDKQLETVDGRLDDHDTHLKTVDGRLDNHDKQLEEHDTRLDGHDATLAQHKDTLDDHETRIGKLETGLNDANADIVAIEDRLDGHDDTLAQHAETLADLQGELDRVGDVADSKAPKMHASADPGYGVGTESLYGHLKLSDAVDLELSIEDGTAATPEAAKKAYDAAVKAQATAEGAQGAADKAQAAAETAQGAADAAQNTADEAVTAAAAAQTAADDAQADADAAQHTADEAAAAAKKAQDTADTGVKNAATAQAAAEAAQQSANNAQNTADSAKTAAQAAQAAADAAQSTADTAQDAADAAQAAADKAQADATSAGSAASKAQTTADTALENAAQAQGTADAAEQTANGTITKAAEALKAAEEAVKTSAEAAVTSEKAEQTANEAKETAESRAPINHKSPEDIYGVGDKENYGHLKLCSDPYQVYGIRAGFAATPKAVNTALNEALETSMPKAGGTFTGDVTFEGDVELSGDPTTNLQPATKQYVDEHVNEALEGLTGAMHYRGTVTAIPPENGSYASGDVVVKGKQEYVYDGSDWRELGSEDSYILKTQIATQSEVKKMLDIWKGSLSNVKLTYTCTAGGKEVATVDGTTIHYQGEGNHPFVINCDYYFDRSQVQIKCNGVNGGSSPTLDYPTTGYAKSLVVQVKYNGSTQMWAVHATMPSTGRDLDYETGKLPDLQGLRQLADEISSGYSKTNHTHSNYVPTTRTVNSHALSDDISLTASDVGAAPKAHAAEATTYGAGSNTNYGHVKLSDSTSGTETAASGGTAATPAAVKSAYDTAAAANTAASAAQTQADKGVADAATAQAAAEAAQKAADAAKAAADGKVGVTYSTTAPVMDGTASAGQAATVARSDHVHPTDTSRAAASHKHAATDITSGVLAVAQGGTGQSSVDNTPTADSAKMVTSGGVYTALAGKAAASHTHNYAGSSTAGGKATSAAAADEATHAKSADTATSATSATSATKADTATKLGSADVGSATKPIYLKAGVPTAANAYPTVPGAYTGTTAGLVPAKTSETASTALWLNEAGKWSKPTAAQVGAAASSHTHTSANISDRVNNTTKGPCGYTGASNDDRLITLNTLSYWNGQYSESTDGKSHSNLAYCQKGAFGDIVTHAVSEFSAASHTHKYAGSASAGGAATKVANALTFTGAATGTYDGSAALSIKIPAATAAPTDYTADEIASLWSSTEAAT